jgi:hypothetical protein
MSENLLTDNQKQLIKDIQARVIAHKKGEGMAPTERELEWRALAVMAMSDNKPLQYDTPSDIDYLDNTTMKTPPIIPTVEAVKTTNTAAETMNQMEESIPEDPVENENLVKQVFMDALKEKGLLEEYESAKEKYGTVWLNSCNGILFGYRSLRLSDMKDTEINDATQEIEYVLDRCIVVNKQAILTEDPPAYMMYSIYDLIRDASGAKVDVPFSVKL